MKKLLTILLLFAGYLQAQDSIRYTPMTAAGYRFRYVVTDSGFNVPYMSTLTTGRGTTRPGAVACYTGDSSLYAFNGIAWYKLSGNISINTSTVDSVIVSEERICVYYLGTERCHDFRLYLTGLQLTVDSTHVYGTNYNGDSTGTSAWLPHTYIREGANIDFDQVADTITISSTGGVSSGLLTGGQVSYYGDSLIYDVTNATYIISGTVYTSPTDTVHLAAADPAFDRIDVIAVNAAGNVVVLKGDPGANPQIPQIDPSSQISLTTIIVKAGTTTPTGVNTTIIYDENVEWARVTLGAITVNYNDNSNPFHLTKNIDVGSFSGPSKSMKFTSPSMLNVSDFSLFKMFLSLKSPLTASGVIWLRFLRNDILVSQLFLPMSGRHGFSNTATGYQNITVPFSDVALSSQTFNQVQVFVSGSGSGLFLDYVQLQGGISNGTSPYITNTFIRNDSLFHTKNGSDVYVGPIAGTDTLALHQLGDTYGADIQMGPLDDNSISFLLNGTQQMKLDKTSKDLRMISGGLGILTTGKQLYFGDGNTSIFADPGNFMRFDHYGGRWKFRSSAGNTEQIYLNEENNQFLKPVNIGALVSPDKSSSLDIQGVKGVLVNRVTSAQRIALAQGIATGTITPGSGYTPGQYIAVTMTGGSGSLNRADITVNGSGQVTTVAVTDRGMGYTVGDALTYAAMGPGTGFLYTLNSVGGPNALMVYDTDSLSHFQLSNNVWQNLYGGSGGGGVTNTRFGIEDSTGVQDRYMNMGNNSLRIVSNNGVGIQLLNGSPDFSAGTPTSQIEVKPEQADMYTQAASFQHFAQITTGTSDLINSYAQIQVKDSIVQRNLFIHPNASTITKNGPGQSGISREILTSVVANGSEVFADSTGKVDLGTVGTGNGTVTSVGISVPSWLTVAGSPVTTTGTLAVTPTSGLTANQFLATPNGTTGAVSLRSIVAADIPFFNTDTLKQDRNPWWKKWVIFGDSFSATGARYSARVDSLLNLTGTVTFGVSGHTYAQQSAKVDSIVAATPTYFTAYNIASILLGVNDFSGNATLGTRSDAAGAASVAGYLKNMIEKIQTSNKNIDLYVMTPPEANGSGVTYHATNGAGWNLNGLAILISQISHDYGVQCIDLHSLIPFNLSTIPTLTSDGLHPNYLGSVFMAGTISQAFISHNNFGIIADSTTYGLQAVTNVDSGTNRKITLTKNGIGTVTPTGALNDIMTIQNTTAAAAGAQQGTGALRWIGRGWGTTAGTSQTVDWWDWVLPVQGTTPTSERRWVSGINGVAATNAMVLSSAGGLTVPAGVQASLGFTSLRPNLITTSGDGYISQNLTAATSGVPVQISPAFRWSGNAWDGSASRTVDFRAEVIPVNGTSPVTSYWKLASQINAGGYSELFRVTNAGNMGIGGAPAATAILDLTSTTKALKLMSMTKVQRDAIATPQAGYMIYQNDNTPGLRVYNGTNWMRFTETAD